MNKVLVWSAVLLLRATWAWAADDTPPPAANPTGLVIRLERGFNEADEAALHSCFHADAVYINPPNRNHGLTHEVASGQALRDLLTMSLQHPVTASAEMLVIDGSGAFTCLEDGSAADVLLTSAVRVLTAGDHPARVGMLEERFAAARRDDDGMWRFAFFFPRFVDPRVVVTAVAPGSQAERLGVLPGDIITHYLMMEMILAQQIPWRWQMFVDDPPDRPLRVLVRRGGDVLSFIYHPGDMGVTTRNHFEGRAGTVTLSGDDARNHPAGQTIGQYLDGFRKADIKQLSGALCPDGYYFHRGLPGGDVSDPITRTDALESVPSTMHQLQERWDFTSLRFSDIRLITHANLALGGWRVCVQTKDAGAIDRHVVVALVRTAAGWTIVGTPWQDDHILGLP